MSETKSEANQWAAAKIFAIIAKIRYDRAKFRYDSEILISENLAMFAKFSLCVIANFF